MNQQMKRFWLGVVVLAGIGPWHVSQAIADAGTAARKHATKANQLAAKNKCKQAVPWFNRAYRSLKDPTLLFNRAECLRKLGENHDALRDYELFLAEVPEAPNRATVESRIAVLKEAIKAEALAGAPSPASGDAGAAVVKELAPGVKPADSAPATSSKESPFAGGRETTPAATGPEPAPTAAKPAGKAPAEPIRRAEKWTD
jgi:tetratricopeptide (TPR) repeat protein